MRKRDVSMAKYGISTKKYRELMYFCMQYEDMKKSLQDEKCIQEIRMIEEAAMEADKELYPYILRAVTMGIPYEYLEVPAGRRKFYEARRKFFYILSKTR